ncbi:MAG: hypothetical protein ACK5UJ_04880 [Pseudobdellovibrionaceae bacterium]
MKIKVFMITLLFSVSSFSQFSSTTTVPQRSDSPYGNLVQRNGDGSARQMQDAAQQGQSKNWLGYIAAGGAAAYCGYLIATNCVTPANVPMCALGVAGLAASIYAISQMSSANRQSSQAYRDVTNGNPVPPITNGSDLIDPAMPPTVQEQFERGRTTLANMERNGFRVNRDGTVRLPNGRTVRPSTFRNKDEFVAAGLSPSSFGAVQAASAGIQQASAAAVAAAADGAPKDGTGADEGGSGAGSSATAASAAVGLGELNMGSAPALAGEGRQTASIGCESVNLNGEPIGVSVDSLFSMINRRYSFENEKEGFIRGGP